MRIIIKHNQEAEMVITRSPLPQHQDNLPLPLFGGNFSVILHGFIRQNYHKNQSDPTWWWSKSSFF